MGCTASTLNTNQVVDIGRREGARSGTPVSLTDWSPDAEKASSSSSVADSITIIHFNDVYNIEERQREPVGGAARFKSQIDSLRHLEPLILFSGDALNPSNISTLTEGRQMIPVLNAIGVHAAVYGNHDFDFGEEHLTEVAKQMDFPWLMSNARLKKTGRRLADGHEKLILNCRGRKIGLIGLIEWEWIVTLATLEPSDVDYTDYVEAAKRLVPELQEEGCDLIVALTHMRDPNDLRLAREVPEIHLILGGHDHHYVKHEIGDVLVLKSGSDFRQFSEITVCFTGSPTSRPIPTVQRYDITKQSPPDQELQNVVDHYLENFKSGLKEEIGIIDCDLEGRFACIRTGECNLGNLITDLMRKATRADIALLNSGTMRSDAVHEKGIFRMEDLMSILPMVDSVSVIEVKGEQLVQALENGVSQYPKLEGRFPQVSGLKFSFDPSQPCGSRVVSDSVFVGDKAMELNRPYKLVTKGYIAHGRDGYDVFKHCDVIVSEEEGPILTSIVRNHFTACSKLQNGFSEVDGFTTSTVRLLDCADGRINPSVEGRIKVIGELDSYTVH